MELGEGRRWAGWNVAMRSLKRKPDKIWERRVSWGEIRVMSGGIMENGQEAPLPVNKHTSVQVVKFVQHTRGFIVTCRYSMAAVNQSKRSTKSTSNQRKVQQQ